MATKPLAAEALEDLMEVCLDAALSSRRTAIAPVREPANFDREQQAFVLHWGAVVAKDNPEQAYISSPLLRRQLFGR